MLNKLSSLNKKVKETSPLVLHITNYVTINDCANITIAAGGAPIMSFEKEELRDLLKISKALVVNIGTINESQFQMIKEGCKIANELEIPIILDAVGVGASKYRNDVIEELISNYKFHVIKGNLGEIKFICGFSVKNKGVDSGEILNGEDDLKNIINKMKKVALEKKCILVATGEKDIITTAKKTYIVENGNEIMGKVSGSGCMLSSVIGSYIGVENTILAPLTAVVMFTIAGEISYEKCVSNSEKSIGLATYKLKLMDNLYKLDFEKLKGREKVYEV